MEGFFEDIGVISPGVEAYLKKQRHFSSLKELEKCLLL